MTKKNDSPGLRQKEFTYGDMENAVYLAADLSDKLIDHFDDSRGMVQFVIDKATEFEKRLGYRNEEEGNYEYLKELEKFEKEILSELE